MACMNKEKKAMQLVFAELTLGLHGDGFDYIFNYWGGGPESLVTNGREWLYRIPKPTFWRALTDNDRGSRFHLKSGTWLSADMFITCKAVSVQVDGEDMPLPVAPYNDRFDGTETAQKVRISYTFETLTVPATEVEVAYEITEDGCIRVDVHYHGNAALPQLPVFGMRFIMPTKAEGYRYEGLSGETYPDRMAGGVPGVYEVEGLPMTPYLVPQDCNVHMQTKWLEVYRNSTLNNMDWGKKVEEPFGLRFEAAEQDFAFSCIPYTASELENATHQEELPPARRTVVSILGAVRGVGGINSWGADVESAYHIDAGKDICYSFKIRPL